MRKGYLLSNPNNAFPESIKKALKQDIPSNKYNIVFVPCNFEQISNNEKYHKINTNWFAECDILFRSNILINKNMSSKEIKTYIGNADILFLMGGLQLEQMKFCYDKAIVNDITDFGGIIIGICAGAINMASDVTSLYLSNMKNPLQTYYKGFSLVDFNIISHLDLSDEFTLINNNYVILPDESAIIVDNNKIQIVGSNKIVKEEKSITSFPSFLKLEVTNKDKFILLLVNVVFINCSNRFNELNKNQIAEFKQMFKYLILELNMNYEHFVELFYITKNYYKISNNDNLDFLLLEYNSINQSLSNAKKEILRNSKMSNDELEKLIYDRYGVKLDEANRF